MKTFKQYTETMWGKPWSQNADCIITTLSHILGMEKQQVFDQFIKDSHISTSVIGKRIDMTITDVLNVIRKTGATVTMVYEGIGPRKKRPLMATMAKQFSESQPNEKFIIVNQTSHVIGVVNGKIYDTQCISSHTRYPTDFVYKISQQ